MIQLKIILIYFFIKQVESTCTTQYVNIYKTLSLYERRAATVNKHTCWIAANKSDNTFFNGFTIHYHGYSNIMVIRNISGNEIGPNFFLPLINRSDRLSFLQIYLNNTNIKRILPGAFNKVSTLQELYIQNNKIQNISAGIFNSLDNLILLNIEKNCINLLSHDAFLGANNIKILYLNNNNITVLAEDTLQPLTKLQFLDISENPLSKTDISLSILYLNIIKINLNNINSVADKIVLKNRNTSISIKIKNFLQVLNMSHSELTFLNNSLFKYFSQLKYLNLSNNFITTLNEDAFVGLNNIISLDLRKNQIYLLPHGLFHNLTKMEYLDLSQNRIEKLEYGTFDSLTNLTFLNLSHNLINELNPYIFRACKKLRELYLDNNFFKKLSLDYLPQLRFVTLDNNLWYCDDLSRIIFKLEILKINILDGSNHKSQNVQKIACSDREFIVINDTTNINKYIIKNVAVTNDEFDKSEFMKFFKEDFRASQFFKFFSNFNGTQFFQYVNDTNKSINKEIQAEKRIDLNERNLKNYKGNSDHSVVNILEIIAMYIIVCILIVLLYMKISERKFKYSVAEIDNCSQIELT